MIYRKFQDLELSMLGMGAMRLPVVEGDDSRIDEAATAKMVDTAMKQGINYYDTAWGYHGGQSELVMGRCLKNYPRENFYLASKFPGFSIENFEKKEEIFERQLEKCQVEYFDFYLFHNVCESNLDWYLDPKYGVYEYLLEQKAKGRIRHLGFSVHASYAGMKRFLEAYGEEMEFAQIQLNYLDWSFQDAKAKAELLRSYNIPIWVMEPVRGGRLASLAEEHEATLKALRPDESIAAWAFRFLQTIPDVTVILSGMSNDAQMADNLHTVETNKPLSDTEWDTLLNIAGEMLGRKVLPCTACRYCTSRCPQGLDIPKLLELYNEHCFTGGGFIAPMVLGTMPEDKRPAACIGCRSCEEVCPQNIKIADAMVDFNAKMRK